MSERRVAHLISIISLVNYFQEGGATRVRLSVTPKLLSHQQGDFFPGWPANGHSVYVGILVLIFDVQSDLDYDI